MDIRSFDENSQNKEKKQPKTFKHIGQKLGSSSRDLKFDELKLPEVSGKIPWTVKPTKTNDEIQDQASLPPVDLADPLVLKRVLADRSKLPLYHQLQSKIRVVVHFNPE